MVRSRFCRQSICATLLLLCTHGALAATINVTTTADEYGINPAACGLREALRAAETNLAFGGCNAGSGTDVINLQAERYLLTRNGTNEDLGSSGDLDVNATAIIIQGGTARTSIIDASGLLDRDRVLHVAGSAAVSLQSVTVAGGLLAAPIANNTFGGGIRVDAGATLTLLNAVVDGNRATTGGGIYNLGTLSATRSTVSNNRASNTGGGLFHSGIMATLTNVTVSGNFAGIAGGIMASRAMTINNSTIARNAAPDAYGAGMRAAGNAAQALTIKTSNSLYADNRGGNAPDDIFCESPIKTGGSNLLENTHGTGCSLIKESIDTPRDLLDDDPHLAPLFDLGNGVPVHALMPDSVAIASGNASGANACNSRDARFRLRPLPQTCDIGAYESVIDYVVTAGNDAADVNPGNGICGTVFPSTGDEILCSLRAAIEEANLAPGTQTIRLGTRTHGLSIPGVNESPRQGDLDIDDAELLIIGNGVGNSIIEGVVGFSERLLDLPTGVNSVALLGVQLRNGNSGSGGGGAVRMFTGSLLLFESQIDDSQGSLGGGLFASTPISESHQILIERSSIARNIASVQGGGAYLNNATLTLRNSSVGENRAAENGGGLKLNVGYSELIYSSITGNRVSGTDTASANGGGISLTQSALSVARGTVIANNLVFGAGATAPDCAAPGFTGSGTGGISLVGYNWLGVSAGCAHEEAEAPNFLDLDARISQLHTLQSATLVPAPQAGSPLLDVIPNALCVDLSSIGMLDDQAGTARPAGATFNCDIGAFEGVSDLIFSDGFD
jgi:CSLREA domain-containing protein